MKQSPALKILHEMAAEAGRKKYHDAGVDPNLSAAPVFKVSKANGLTKAVIKFLQLNGWQAERINTMGRMIDQRQTYYDILGHHKQIGTMKYIPTTGQRGSADISAMGKSKKGALIAWKIEIKIGKDRQSDVQKEYQKAIERAGGHYSIVKTIDDFLEQFNKLIND